MVSRSRARPGMTVLVLKYSGDAKKWRFWRHVEISYCNPMQSCRVRVTPSTPRVQLARTASCSSPAVWNIYRYAFFSVIGILLTVIRIWYAYQKRWYIYHLTSSIRMGVHIAQRCETHTALAFKLTVHVWKCMYMYRTYMYLVPYGSVKRILLPCNYRASLLIPGIYR